METLASTLSAEAVVGTMTEIYEYNECEDGP